MSPQWNGRYAGKPALATKGTHGYPYGSIDDKPFQAHRVIWALYYGEWPALEIDHINGVRDDNRIVNLRQATSAQNSQNIGAYSNSKTGIRGVSWSNAHKRWVARIMVERKHINLGYFTDIKDAERAYLAAAAKLHGEFTRTPRTDENHGRKRA